MSVFGTSRGFGALCLFGAAVTGWLVSRDFTTEEQLVATLKRKNNVGKQDQENGTRKFNELLRQIKDPNAENKTFEELLKRGVTGPSTPMKPIDLPPPPPPPPPTSIASSSNPSDQITTGNKGKWPILVSLPDIYNVNFYSIQLWSHPRCNNIHTYYIILYYIILIILCRYDLRGEERASSINRLVPIRSKRRGEGFFDQQTSFPPACIGNWRCSLVLHKRVSCFEYIYGIK